MGNHVTAGFTKTFTATPVVSTSPAYSAKDAIGGKLIFSNAVGSINPAAASLVAGASYSGSGIIQSICLVDQAMQAQAIDVVFFNADPSGTTFTDNAVLDIADADALKIIGHVSIATTDYSSFNDNCIATKNGLGLAFVTSGSTTLYACLVARGTPTFAATTDVQLMVTILQDL